MEQTLTQKGRISIHSYNTRQNPETKFAYLKYLNKSFIDEKFEGSPISQSQYYNRQKKIIAEEIMKNLSHEDLRNIITRLKNKKLVGMDSLSECCNWIKSNKDITDLFINNLFINYYSFCNFEVKLSPNLKNITYDDNYL